MGSDPTHPAVGLLRVPLWLWAAGKLGPAQAAALIRATTADEARRVLTDASLANSISALARDRRVSLDTAGCRRALAAIAGFLADPRSPDATTFRLENLTPPVPSLAQRRALSSAVSLAAAAIIGVLAHDLGWLDLWPDVPLLAIGLALLTMLRPDAGDTDALRRAGGGVQFRHALLAARLGQEAPDPGLMHLRQHLGATTDSSG